MSHTFSFKQPALERRRRHGNRRQKECPENFARARYLQHFARIRTSLKVLKRQRNAAQNQVLDLPADDEPERHESPAKAWQHCVRKCGDDSFKDREHRQVGRDSAKRRMTDRGNDAHTQMVGRIQALFVQGNKRIFQARRGIDRRGLSAFYYLFVFAGLRGIFLRRGEFGILEEPRRVEQGLGVLRVVAAVRGKRKLYKAHCGFVVFEHDVSLRGGLPVGLGAFADCPAFRFGAARHFDCRRRNPEKRLSTECR